MCEHVSSGYLISLCNDLIVSASLIKSSCGEGFLSTTCDWGVLHVDSSEI